MKHFSKALTMTHAE